MHLCSLAHSHFAPAIVIRIMENEMETAIVYWGCIRIMEDKMEIAIAYWGYTGIIESVETTTATLFQHPDT